MTIIKNILLVLNIMSFFSVIIIFPFGVYEFFAGRERAENLLRKINISFKYTTIEILFLICLGICIATYIIRDLMSNI